MRSLLWTASAAALLAFTSPASALTGKELLQRCEALERGAVVKGKDIELPAGRPPAECWSYMGAVQDFTATVEREGGPSLLGSCVPPDTTRLDIVRTFTRYARAHRSDLDLRASALVVQALAAAYRCPEQRGQ